MTTTTSNTFPIDASYEPVLFPRPIIICNSCGRPFDAKRETEKEWVDTTRCEFCGSKHTMRDVIGNRVSIANENEDLAQLQSKSGLYIIQSSDGRMKIGISTNIVQRMRALKTDSPLQIEVKRKYEHSDAKALEKHLHQELDAYNAKGEWFEIDDRPVDAFLDSVDLLVDEWGGKGTRNHTEI